MSTKTRFEKEAKGNSEMVCLRVRHYWKEMARSFKNRHGCLSSVFRVFFGLLQAHITSILRSKFTDFRNFDTSLYTCAPEFDFLDPEVGTLEKREILENRSHPSVKTYESHSHSSTHVV